uniref:Secreted protein n=1 Tax=Mycena chlorophos TaxID=658473 RepID=A0ABQ0M069_MYCCL|nr:predicted protein [Mycena chlorophos]
MIAASASLHRRMRTACLVAQALNRMSFCGDCAPYWLKLEMELRSFAACAAAMRLGQRLWDVQVAVSAFSARHRFDIAFWPIQHAALGAAASKPESSLSPRIFWVPRTSHASTEGSTAVGFG